MLTRSRFFSKTEGERPQFRTQFLTPNAPLNTKKLFSEEIILKKHLKLTTANSQLTPTKPLKFRTPPFCIVSRATSTSSHPGFLFSISLKYLEFNSTVIEAVLHAFKSKFPQALEKIHYRPATPLAAHYFQRVDREGQMKLFFQILNDRFKILKTPPKGLDLRAINQCIALLSGPGGGKSFLSDEIAKFKHTDIKNFFPSGSINNEY
jgi:hypothetical protein